ncbi:MAG: Spy/CpxP family protein refolding chaperone [Desulfomonilaceae bacterium]
MRFTRVTVLAASMMLLLVASAASAQQMGCCSGGGGKGAAIWGDLTSEQQKQVTALRNEFFKKQETLRSDMAKKRIEMMELASKENPDEQAIEKKKQEIWASQDAMRNEGRAMGTKFRALLTPEQKQKLGPGGPGFGGMNLGGGSGFGGGGCGLGGGRGCGGCAGRISSL